ncbi:MAG TPA: EamA family transporter [Vicinamibacterales bacterium]|nr:EamA family transporter [Vicinamibacterales bacterium]
MTPVASPRERLLAYAAWITICVVWGTTYLAIRVALETVPVALLGGLRWTVAGAILVGILLIRKEALPRFHAWGSIALSGFLLIIIGNGGVVWAEQYVASGLAAVLVAVVPFWNVLVEAVLPRGERLTIRALAGLIVGFVGIVILVWPEITLEGQDSRLFIAGLVALQIACFGWALGTAFTKRRATGASPLGAAAVQMVISGVIMIAIGTVAGEWSRLAFSTRSASALIYLTLIGSIVGYSAYVYALKYLPISQVSQYAYVNPLIAVGLGALLLGEPFTTRTIVAAVLVLVGIAVVRSAAPGSNAPVARRSAA